MEVGECNVEVIIQRPVLDEQKLESLSERQSHDQNRPPIAERLKRCTRCTVPRLKKLLYCCFPILHWIPQYSITEYALPDVISGISVGIMHLPQGMAYALLVAVPPVYGLYTSLFPALVYFFFGTSRHISVGTLTVLSLMVGTVTQNVAPDENFLFNGTNSTSEIDVEARDLRRVQVAAATTVLAGFIQVVLGLVQFGFVATYLSEPLVRAYTTGAAVHTVVSQLKYLFGVSPIRHSGPLALIYTLIDVCSLLPKTHLPTLGVSIISMVVLIAAKEFNAAFRHKMPVPIPVELLFIVIATLASTYGGLSDYKIPVVGEIPSGLRPPTVPDVSLFGEVFGDAFAIAIVAYAISISLGKTFALKHGYRVNSNQELVALGLSNTVGGFFQCFAACPSMSRSLVQESTGGQTQMASIYSGLIVLVTVLKLGYLFQELPKAVLAAIAIVNLKGMFKQLYDIVTLWRSNKVDLLIWLVTWVSTMLLNLDMGLGASIAFAMLTVTFRTQRPRYSLLGHVPRTELYMDKETHKAVKEVPGIIIFRSSATVYFANAEFYLETLKKKSGLDISEMIAYKRRKEAKQKRKDEKAAKKAKKEAKKEAKKLAKSIKEAAQTIEEVEEHRTENGVEIKEAVEDGQLQEKSIVLPYFSPDFPSLEAQNNWVNSTVMDPDTNTEGSTEQDKDSAVQGSSSEETSSPALEKASRGSLGKWTWDIHTIILDLSTANFIDTVAIKLIRNIIRDYCEIDVDVYLAGCQVSMVEEMERGGFFSDSITKECLFATVHDAVMNSQFYRDYAVTPNNDVIQDIIATRF